MPGGDARRAAQLSAALQWDRGRWIWLLLILLFLHLLLGLGDSVTLALRYDRAGLAAGGWWRLLSAHIVHLDLHHLVLNELGLVLMWSLFAGDYDPVDWLTIVLAGALAIGAGLWWLSPGVSWYVGASGVLHAVMAAGTAQHIAVRSWDRWLLLACLGIKLTMEQVSQFMGHTSPLIVVDAHLYGALAGFAVGAALCWRMAIIRDRISG
jgi:rhomboid family GlyGly-CTERM serine protease